MIEIVEIVEILRALLAKATPGPWYGVASDDYAIDADAYPERYAGRFSSDDTGSHLAMFGNRPSDYGEANRDLAAEAITALPGLLDTVETLTAERDRFLEALEHISVARSAMEGGSIAECRRLARAALGDAS